MLWTAMPAGLNGVNRVDLPLSGTPWALFSKALAQELLRLEREAAAVFQRRERCSPVAGGRNVGLGGSREFAVPDLGRGSGRPSGLF